MRMFKVVTPDLQVGSVLELDVERLRTLGLDALLLDVDCTLKIYPSDDLAPGVAEWLSQMQSAGIKLCLVSNGRKRRIGPFARKLGLAFIARSAKPLPFGCQQALKLLEVPAGRAAMVGDQIFADVMAGRLAGIRTILVRPMSPHLEPLYTRLKRPMERWILRRLNRIPPPAENEPELKSRPPGDD